MPFVRPDAERRRAAIGPLTDLPPALQRAFDAEGFFEPVPEPGRHDWLNVAAEKGQAYEAFTRTVTDRREGAQRLYLQPLGDFSGAQHALLQQLPAFGSAFFAREVRVLPAIAVAGNGVEERHNPYTGITQLKTRDLLSLLVRRLPADASCMLGMTALDLYPSDRWSFVFGEAMLDERVAVFSIARYDPRFYDKPADPTLLLKRACKVLAHETCHMLGVRHCIFFNCLMNGSNHLDESDRRPFEACPIDLRKLHWSLGFDIVERYRNLLRFWRDAGVEDAAGWVERRLAFIEAGDREARIRG